MMRRCGFVGRRMIWLFGIIGLLGIVRLMIMVPRRDVVIACVVWVKRHIWICRVVGEGRHWTCEHGISGMLGSMKTVYESCSQKSRIKWRFQNCYSFMLRGVHSSTSELRFSGSQCSIICEEALWYIYNEYRPRLGWSFQYSKPDDKNIIANSRSLPVN